MKDDANLKLLPLEELEKIRLVKAFSVSSVYVRGLRIIGVTGFYLIEVYYWAICGTKLLPLEELEKIRLVTGFRFFPLRDSVVIRVEVVYLGWVYCWATCGAKGRGWVREDGSQVFLSFAT